MTKTETDAARVERKKSNDEWERLASHHILWWQSVGCGTPVVPVLGTEDIVYTQPI